MEKIKSDGWRSRQLLFKIALVLSGAACVGTAVRYKTTFDYYTEAAETSIGLGRRFEDFLALHGQINNLVRRFEAGHASRPEILERNAQHVINVWTLLKSQPETRKGALARAVVQLEPTIEAVSYLSRQIAEAKRQGDNDTVQRVAQAMPAISAGVFAKIGEVEALAGQVAEAARVQRNEAALVNIVGKSLAVGAIASFAFLLFFGPAAAGNRRTKNWIGEPAGESLSDMKSRAA